MTYEEFSERLKALLREADDDRLEVEHICEIVEHIIEMGWDSPKEGTKS